MKVIILGSGVIGVTTAYYLAKAGHEVTVIDRQEGPALETSFANAGQLSYGYSTPWAAPGIPQKAAMWLFKKHSPLIFRPTCNPAMYSWLMSMLANCTASAYATNKARMLRISNYSRECLTELRNDTGISYDEGSKGTLQLFRSQKDFDAVMTKDIESLRQDGIKFEVLDAEGCTQAEPALANVKHMITGGLRMPDDGTGDCFTFTNKLAKMAEELGVKFHYNVDIKGFQLNSGKIVAVETNKGTFTADRYVAALGSFTPHLVKGLGLNVPIYPVKGYSITIPIIDESRAPVSTILDETYKIAITRLGDRIRVGGMAEVTDYVTRLLPERRETLELSVGGLFGGAGDLSKATFWSGLRPMTPDSTPIIGGTKYDNLYINAGHGTLGWTMSAGSARVMADLISGKKPDIDTSDLGLSRYK